MKKTDATVQPYQHFVTRFSLSGDVDVAKTLIKTGEREMGILRKQLGHQDLMQGYRETAPFIGARINCSIVGTVRLIEIYVTPQYPLAPKEYEERPCFCNCCLAECQIVKVDGTWRNNDHYDIPLPDLGYKHGDRRLRYDIDVCSFLGISPESGLLTYEFYRVENVMPSDFTPYEVGDWAMVYFTDLARETECGKCEDCDPPLTDELGRVWGCIPRDVTEALNTPQCIILPIAINDRISRSTVYFRPLESMRLGTCIKKAVIDWVQYSKLDEEDKPIDGYANIRWDAWPSIPGGTVVDNIPIRYCTQDFTNQDGSHAYRWGNSVYVLMEGENWTVIGRDIAELPTYTSYGVSIRMINPALIIIKVYEEQMYTTNPDQDYWIPEPRCVAFDFTHDTELDFKKYSWAEDKYVFPLPEESVSRLIFDYFRRGAVESSSFRQAYGYPSVSYESMVHIQPSTYYSGVSGTHTHAGYYSRNYLDNSGYGAVHGGVKTLYDQWGFPYSQYVTKFDDTSFSYPFSVWIDIPSESTWTPMEFDLSGLDLVHWGGYNPSQPLGWAKTRHTGGTASFGESGRNMRIYHDVELMFAYPLPGYEISVLGFDPSFKRYWNGFVGCATCDEKNNSYTGEWELNMTGTWEYLNLFSGRSADRASVLSWSGSISRGEQGYEIWLEGNVKAAMGLPGFAYAVTSSVMLKMVECRYDVVNSSMARGSAANHRDVPTQRFHRVELGGVRSRYDDPFTDGLGSTKFYTYEKPNMIDGINNFIETIPILWNDYRDNYLEIDVPLTSPTAEKLTIDLLGLHARIWKNAFRYLTPAYAMEHQLRIIIV